MSTQELNRWGLASLIVSALCALAVITDISSDRRQKMAVMYAVWPVTAIWAGPLGLTAYWLIGRNRKQPRPFWQTVLVSDSHCGAGCTLGDLIGELMVFRGGFAIGGSVLLASFAVDFAFAFAAGILFQYFSIAPMRGISGWPSIKAAVRADAVSLIAFETGMFAWMSIARTDLKPTQPGYWLSMQAAMLVGFATAYPANWFLIRRRVKEPM